MISSAHQLMMMTGSAGSSGGSAASSAYTGSIQSCSRSSGSDILNSSFGESTSSIPSTSSPSQAIPRIRTIRLRRPSVAQSRNLLMNTNPTLEDHQSLRFGFSLRGGREFRTGFFVSHVDRSSEADRQGLRVGDQICRVNGYHVDDAIHTEISQFIASQTHLTLRVRGIGMIPVKERDSDPLSWHFVPPESKTGDYDELICRDVRVNLTIAPRKKLGLGICKGPEWKPGIFVQFTKEHGISRAAGLKPGDQILSCNGVEFTDIFFNDAVAIMKSSNHLDLVVRTAVGVDLFPGESSGYNSSASSVTGGDQSPCWNDLASKRNSEIDARSDLSASPFNGAVHSKMKSPFRPKSWDKGSLDFERSRKERLLPVTTPKVPQLTSFQAVNPMNSSANLNEISSIEQCETSTNSNTTIIKLSENGTIINNTLIPHLSATVIHPQKSTTTVTLEASNENAETISVENVGPKTVLVEVHRGLNDQQQPQHQGMTITKPNRAPPPPPPSCKYSPQNSTEQQPEAKSASSSLSDEIKRRAERICDQNRGGSIEEKIQAQTKKTGNMDTERHNALMDEFKIAHRKMFKNSKSADSAEVIEERQQALRLRRNEIERDVPDSNGHAPPAVPQKPISNGLTSPKTAVAPIAPPVAQKSSPILPPPLPPIQFADEVPVIANGNGAPIITIANGKPMTPTPDYDSLSSVPEAANVDVVSAAPKLQNGGSAEKSIPAPPPMMPSLVSPQAKFQRAPSLSKQNRSISVTIGEYRNGNDNRREPSKFSFLNKAESIETTAPKTGEVNVTNDFKNELQMTLSRSNLRKTTEVDVPKTNGHLNGFNGVPKANFNGSPGFPNNKVKPILQKTGSANIEKLTSMLNARQQKITSMAPTPAPESNKVTISIPNTVENDTKSVAPNGILKNGATPVTNGSTGIEPKNITFDNITTVIGIAK